MAADTKLPAGKKWADRRQRALAILAILKKTYPTAKCSLDHHTPMQLLVATILSAQSTDQRINLVTPGLFKKYPNAQAFADASQEELESDIRSTGFFRSKAKALRAMAQALVTNHGGQVPQTMEELTGLAGVGRKTANVVLGNAFGQNVGIVVDTHVTRLANRLRLTDHPSDAVKIEQDLVRIIPQEDWTLWSHLLIFHGRSICTARNPACEKCPIFSYCPTGSKILKDRGQTAQRRQKSRSLRARLVKEPRTK
ncbi:MAG TPA: endonuclease III [Tepidisphaeraceae bacterium]|jgi:endonuclease-3|nr:endonuclease III [Tepidisphaeraceae bacterium]